MPELTLHPVRLKLREPLFDAVATHAMREYRELPAQIEQFIVEGLERHGALPAGATLVGCEPVVVA